MLWTVKTFGTQLGLCRGGFESNMMSISDSLSGIKAIPAINNIYFRIFFWFCWIYVFCFNFMNLEAFVIWLFVKTLDRGGGLVVVLINFDLFFLFYADRCFPSLWIEKMKTNWGMIISTIDIMVSWPHWQKHF